MHRRPGLSYFCAFWQWRALARGCFRDWNRWAFPQHILPPGTALTNPEACTPHPPHTDTAHTADCLLPGTLLPTPDVIRQHLLHIPDTHRQQLTAFLTDLTQDLGLSGTVVIIIIMVVILLVLKVVTCLYSLVISKTSHLIISFMLNLLTHRPRGFLYVVFIFYINQMH